MNNIINYCTHVLYKAPYYYRQAEKDLPKTEDSPSLAKRTALIALPFLCLYQPFGRTISITMGSTRVLTSGVGVITASDMSTCTFQVAKVGLATLALVGTFYNFTLGLCLSTGADLISNLAVILDALYNSQYEIAGEELLQALMSGLYLAIMTTGSLEIVVTSLLIQALVCFYQARKEWLSSEEKGPEAFAKALMGMIRLYQANQQLNLLRQRNVLFKEYREMTERLQKARTIDHLWDHPLVKQQATIIEDGNGKEYNLGAYLHGYGKQVVKGMNLHLKEEGGHTTLEFKVNHVFRDRLNDPLRDLQTISSHELRALLQFSHSHIEDISISERTISHNSWMDLGTIRNIHLKGLGTISIRTSEEVLTLYDKISIQMETGKTLYDFHEILSLFNLDDALRQSASEDIERMKIGHLFRILFPKAATLFERSDAFFDLPLEEFKRRIVSLCPKMENAFKILLPHMELKEVLPGKMRYTISGLSQALQNTGLRGLTTALMGAWTNQSLCDRVTSILKMGLFSSEIRNDHQMDTKGLSWGADYISGGADSVFTQVVTDQTKNYTEYWYQNRVRFLISPKILEFGSYQYHDDNFGSRVVDWQNFWWSDSEYIDRDNIFDFVANERFFFNGDNEVMIKDRIAPEFLTGIVVDTEETKIMLLNALRNRNIIQRDAFGRETILSKLVDNFILTSSPVRDKDFLAGA